MSSDAKQGWVVVETKFRNGGVVVFGPFTSKRAADRWIRDTVMEGARTLFRTQQIESPSEVTS